jgi:SAM-dependent methyltransferase
MERAEWLKHIRSMAEKVYDHISPGYPDVFGRYENDSQVAFIRKLLARLDRGGTILSAACGAGRYDGLLLDMGHNVVGTDQSAGMLERARMQYPQARYEKVGLQEMDFHKVFDGAICMDAMEHISPEDWPGILNRFADALKPGGLLYFNSDPLEQCETAELQEAYERAKDMGLPVIYGEVADQVDASYQQAQAREQEKPFQPSDSQDSSVYHYHPPLAQIHAWLDQAGFAIQEEGDGSCYHHILARKK